MGVAEAAAGTGELPPNSPEGGASQRDQLGQSHES